MSRLVERRGYVGLGTNLGDRAANLDEATRRLGDARITVLRSSTTVRSPPMGPVEQPDFENRVVEIATPLEPRPLLGCLKAIERAMGRVPTVRWGPRRIDLDLLILGDLERHEPGLDLPHAGLAERWFVLAPLCELAPALVVPGLGRTAAELLAALSPPSPALATGARGVPTLEPAVPTALATSLEHKP